jgi:GAF domain-containing protein
VKRSQDGADPGTQPELVEVVVVPEELAHGEPTTQTPAASHRAPAESDAASRRALAEAELLFRIATAASHESELDRILSAALDHLSAVIQFTGGSVAVVEEDRLVIRAARGPFARQALGQHLTRGQGRSWQIVDRGEPVFSNDVVADGLQPTTPFRSFMGVPLSWRGVSFGVLEIDSPENNAFAAEDLALLQKVALALSGPIEQARLYQAAQEAIRVREAFLGIASHEL